MLNGLCLFSGVGGKSLALQGIVKTVGYCEIDPYCQKVLQKQMQRGKLQKAKIFTDVRKLSIKDLSSQVDIIYGGFPCQDISSMGLQKGLEGERSGLVKEVFRLTKECKPTYVFLENVSAIIDNGLEEILREFTKLGYDCRWKVISASMFGAPHERKRFFILCERQDIRTQVTKRSDTKVSETTGDRRLHNQTVADSPSRKHVVCKGFDRAYNARLTNPRSVFTTKLPAEWRSEPTVGRVVNGIPNRIHRCAALGNAVVPICVRYAFLSLLFGI